ncbi:MAG: hypothetical protein IPI49_33245 [Myxococcales bacterium]|nr:hypothetical protein [Myxococcales bacterium]
MWAALWTVVLVKWISPWGPSIAGSLADVGAMLWPSAELSSAGPLASPRRRARPAGDRRARSGSSWSSPG